MKDCDILILTAAFGSGHLTTAKAVQEHLMAHDQTLNINIVDFYKLTSPHLSKGLYSLYKFLVNNGIPIYNYYYYKKDEHPSLIETEKSFSQILRKLSEYLEDTKPQMIISTFPGCSGYVSRYKKESGNKVPLVTCVTDAVAANEWLHDYTDLYIVASAEIKEALISKRIPADNISVSVPVRRQFFSSYDRSKLRTELNVKPDETLLLFMGGGSGLLPSEDNFYEELQNLPDTKSFLLTGSNSTLYNQLAKYNQSPNITVLGFIENIAEYMQAADLLITKPGGITIYEALCSGLPLLIYRPVVGQEIENSRFINKNNLGIITHSTQELVETLHNLTHNKGTVLALRRNVSNFRFSLDLNPIDEVLWNYYQTSALRKLNVFI